METLPNRHLMTLSLDVDFAGIVPIGTTAAGQRGIAPVRGGRFEGGRLRGTVSPGHDWFITRADGALLIDVRLVLTTGDGAKIYLAYQGRMLGNGDAMARFRKGELLGPDDYALQITAKFECGDERYAWLNDVLAVGVGEHALSGPIYHIFEVGR